ncbi:MAG: amidohydrolase family protein [Luteitalea sp.]|nr:amidohydrolase family protein [Luteitalea sp.]
MRRALVPLLLVLGGLVAQQASGQLRSRPGQERTPEWPAPSIIEYEPKSTLVVAEHPTPHAKFPVIDIHSHQPTPISPEQLDKVVAAMDSLNLRVLVNLSGRSGDRLREGLAAIENSQHADRMVLFANIDFDGGVGPGFGAAAAAQLESDFEAGALGLKIFKNLGLRVTRTDGARLKLDDPELDPIWETCARLNRPVLIHTADPAPFFDPIDMSNERWLELALFSSRRYQDPAMPRFEELMAERDRLFARHPKTQFIAAHMGWHANDLDRLGRWFEKFPNVFVDTGAVLAEIGRQPRAAREFFIRYQDRVLFGKDSFQPDEFPYYWRTFETADEYFDYYRDYHAFWKLYGLELPDEVLRKVYSENAAKLIPALE